MSRKIVKNPETGNYQIFSSIVDAFILDDEFTREELAEFWEVQYGEEGMEDFEKRMKALDKTSGPLHTQSIEEWKHAKMWDTHQAEHGLKSRDANCAICKDIAKDEAEYAKKGRS